MRPALVSIVAAALLVVAPGASAGPPHGICRHVSAEKCEEILGPYNAAQFLHMYVMRKLQGRITAQTGSTLYCGAARHHRPWFFRCGETITSSGLPSPCTVEALVARPKPGVHRFVWLMESASCKP
jgi:hypothetical protein